MMHLNIRKALLVVYRFFAHESSTIAGDSGDSPAPNQIPVRYCHAFAGFCRTGGETYLYRRQDYGLLFGYAGSGIPAGILPDRLTPAGVVMRPM